MAHRQPSSRRTGDAGPDLQIGEFVRGKEIGKGSFASVYLATHTRKRSYVAIKAVDQKKLTRKLKENLESEIRILKSLQHPHIVALFSCNETATHIYLVMEYCQLSDLAHFMKKREQLPNIPETADIFRKYPNSSYGLNEVVVRHFVKQIASALQYLRNRNLIHRDIKPQNLLLNPSPAFMARQRPEDVPLAASTNSLVPDVGLHTLPMLKVADFGFARHLPQTMMAETLCGSPLYMAPEILSYHKYDAKADLWSMGTVTYEMMVGKPPFRAANHIELLKKIEDAKDRIPFPNELRISADLHRMIRHLLKKDPNDRITFEGFFQSPPVLGPIPGLVGEDVPRTASVPIPDSGLSEITRRMQEQVLDTPPNPSLDFNTGRSVPRGSPVIRDGFGLAHDSAAAPAMQRAPSGSRDYYAGGATQPLDIKRTRPVAEERPPMVTHATAPARDLTLNQRYSATKPAGVQRTSSIAAPPPSTSVPKEHSIPPNVRTERRLSPHDEDREKTAHDLAFEKEYVLIEKRTVEVNAFADELAAGSHLQNRGQPGNIARRATTHGLPTLAAGAKAAATSTAMQIIGGGRRPETSHTRQSSYERRLNPSSTTNMLSKAINMANQRLWGAAGASPPLPGGMSPPRGYSAFPAYPTPSMGLAITSGKEELRGAQDDDTRILRVVEDAATRSDTVFSFAEVKYRQLLPATPSADDRLNIRQIGALEKASPLLASGERSDLEDDQELTQIAVVAVSEEALVLFVKALSILAKAIDLASFWWVSHRRASAPSPPTDMRSVPRANTDVSRRMNSVVQWMRNRFNECLEKSEVVGRRLVEAQKHLPPDHPGHPSNHPAASAEASGGSSKLGSNPSSAASIGAAAENIQLTSGVTAEKLMFERAVEMSRAAAVNELVGEDLRGCEISYKTALILLEAVLEADDEPLLPQAAAKGKEATVAGLEGEDRTTVLQLLESAKHRLRSLQRKLQNAEREPARRPSLAPSISSQGSGKARAVGSPLTSESPR